MEGEPQGHAEGEGAVFLLLVVGDTFAVLFLEGKGKKNMRILHCSALL
jgi:hypothetical protein